MNLVRIITVVFILFTFSSVLLTFSTIAVAQARRSVAPPVRDVPPLQLPSIRIQPPTYTLPPSLLPPSLESPSGLPDLPDTPPPSLLPPSPGGSSGGEGPVTVGVAYVVAVCIFSSNLSDDCLRSGKLEATARLSDLYVKQYLKSRNTNSLTLLFPGVMARTKQIRFLANIEMQAIKTVVAIMQRDVANLTPFAWETEQERQAKEAFVRNDAIQVKQWEQDAISEANRDSSWSHDWSSNSHTFQTGAAFRQLQNISIRGFGGM